MSAETDNVKKWNAQCGWTTNGGRQCRLTRGHEGNCQFDTAPEVRPSKTNDEIDACHKAITSYCTRPWGHNGPCSSGETTEKELVESLSHEGQKDAWLDDLLAYLHYDPVTKAHPDWVAHAQAAEAEVAVLRAALYECLNDMGSTAGGRPSGATQSIVDRLYVLLNGETPQQTEQRQEREAGETNDARDASRYRWLRNADPMRADPELFPTLDGTALDDGIDAAMTLTALKANEVRVQACRPEDRAMLQTEAGQELLKAATEAMRSEKTSCKHENLTIEQHGEKVCGECGARLDIPRGESL